MDSRKLAFMSHVLRPAFLEHLGAVPPGSNPPPQSLVYCLVPEVPFLGECWQGSRHFWGLQAMALCLVATKKALFQTHMYVGHSTNTSIRWFKLAKDFECKFTSSQRSNAQGVLRFNTSHQNNIGEDRIWIIKKSRLVDQHRKIGFVTRDGSRKYEAINN